MKHGGKRYFYERGRIMAAGTGISIELDIGTWPPWAYCAFLNGFHGNDINL